jgi:hypothetical protein
MLVFHATVVVLRCAYKVCHVLVLLSTLNILKSASGMAHDWMSCSLSHAAPGFGVGFGVCGTQYKGMAFFLLGQQGKCQNEVEGLRGKT